MFGGSWNSTGPSLSPSPSDASASRSTADAVSTSRLSWVIRRGLLSAKRNSGGVSPAQRASTSAVGMR